MPLDKRRGFLFIIFLLTIKEIPVAQDVSDSLKNILQSGANYNVKKKAYLQFGERYTLKNFDETLVLINEGILLAIKNNDLLTAGVLKRYMGAAYYFKGEYAHA